MRSESVVSGLAILVAVSVCRSEDKPALVLSSPAFANGAAMAARYTCQGENVSPPLEWKNLPAGTKSLVLIVEDPDAPDPKKPKLVWDHWLLYDIPPSATGLAENVKSALPAGTREALNSWKKTGYGGPCPPIGRHRYFHRLFALDKLLGDLKTPAKAALLKAMEGHVLATVELVGTYEKSR